MQRYSRERHSGMDWRRRYKPLFQFGKKARVTLWLLVPLFYSTAFCKISCKIIGDFAEGCRFSLFIYRAIPLFQQLSVKKAEIFFVLPENRTLPTPHLKDLSLCNIRIFECHTTSKSNVYKKTSNNFSYVFSARTLYQLRLEVESNGRAVRT